MPRPLSPGPTCRRVGVSYPTTYVGGVTRIRPPNAASIASAGTPGEEGIIPSPVDMSDPARIRIVTATSLFDGHDASINIMRRILQSSGAEVILLGHDRSAAEIAEAAVEVDAHAIAGTSYPGGHMVFFRSLRQLLDQMGG